MRNESMDMRPAGDGHSGIMPNPPFCMSFYEHQKKRLTNRSFPKSLILNNILSFGREEQE
jgi:hypothetical protein